MPVACPVIDLTAADSDPGDIVVSSSSEDEAANSELAEARHLAAQARVRLLEARVRERLAARAERRASGSSSDASRPPTPVLPVAAAASPAVTPPRTPWRRRAPLALPPPSPIAEIPVQFRPRDPALHALRQSEQRELAIEMAQIRAERDALAKRRAEVEARAAAIEATIAREVEARLQTPPGLPRPRSDFQTPERRHFRNQDAVFVTPEDGMISDPDPGFQTPGYPSAAGQGLELVSVVTPLPSPRMAAGNGPDLRVAAGDGPDPDPESSSSESNSANRHRRRELSVSRPPLRDRELAPYKVKSTELKLGAWPTTIQFASWRRALRAAVASASDRPELATAWIFEVESSSASFEAFRLDARDRLRTLDAKLAEALGRVVKGETARRVAIASEKAALEGSLLTGRQILFMVYQEFKRDESKTDHVAYGNLERLGSVTADAALEGFMSTWEAVLLAFKTPPTEAHLYSAFYARLCRVPGLATTIAHIDRQVFGHEDKSYAFLHSASTRLVQQRREERQAAELAKLYTQPGGGNALAATADKKSLPCFKLRDGAKCEAGDSCPYSHDRQVIEQAKKAKAKSKGKGKGGDGKGKNKGKGKGKVKGTCNFYNSPAGCTRGSACPYLHEAPAMAAKPATAPEAAPAKKI